jgi:hypothetical protein
VRRQSGLLEPSFEHVRGIGADKRAAVEIDEQESCAHHSFWKRPRVTTAADTEGSRISQAPDGGPCAFLSDCMEELLQFFENEKNNFGYSRIN